ncbi:MAG: hypothetical protein JXM79_13195 [Sedimentisphaerales bacterium]|nr:hypothetical protein [Sedimentisphaerales bacterium]
MSEGKRPGGLTAPAVIHFVFVVWDLIVLLGLAATFAFIGKIPTDQMNETQKALLEALKNLGLPAFIFIIVLSIVSSRFQ